MGERRTGAAVLLVAAAAVDIALIAVACAPRQVAVVQVRPAHHVVAVASAAWRIPTHQPSTAITGYADQTDVAPGELITFFVSTSAPSYRVSAYRMGWYGGKGAGLVWRSKAHKGALQEEPTVSAETNTVVADWRRSFTVGTAGWPEGVYLFALSASDGTKHYVPVVLRSRSVAGKLVLLSATATWQAYNAWGGYSLYHGPNGDARKRATVVSFDRPYDGTGADLFLSFEQPVVAFAEEVKLPVAYLTSADIASQPDALAGARGVISLGHDEYWTSSMRKAVEAARDAGANVAFLGANAVFRHIRFENGPHGANRLEVNYRTEADPLMATDPDEVTTNWREPPRPRPESVITGALYECNPVDAAYVVPKDPKWPLSTGGLHEKAEFDGLVGPEYDRVDPAFTTPRPISVLSHSPVRCRGHESYADTSYYTAESGAGVFDAGTMRWVCALGGGCRNHGVTTAATTFVRRVTAALLREFAAGPAGKAHAAVDNVDEVGEILGDATVGRGHAPTSRVRHVIETVPSPRVSPHSLPTLPAPTKPSAAPTAKPHPSPAPKSSGATKP